MVPEQAPLIILDIKSAMCMENNGKYIKHTRHTSRIINFLRNVEDLNLQKNIWCERGLHLEVIGTNNVRDDELNPILEYTMLILDN